MAVDTPAIGKIRVSIERYQERAVRTERCVYSHVTALCEIFYSISRPEPKEQRCSN